MPKMKISLIGAGSGCFSVGLIKELSASPHLHECTVSMMDIDSGRLDAVCSVSERLIRETGSGLAIERTMDRAASLAGADFVINTALAAPHERLREGWNIAEKYGFRFGGGAHVMHDEAFWINFYQLRFFESLTEDILRLCPDAWHIMVANPVKAGITHIRRKFPEAKIVGMCHGYAGIYEIAERLGLNREDITYEIPGINHFVWLRKGFAGGEDLFQKIDAWLETDAEKHWQTCGISDALGKKRIDFYKKHGVIGIGDTMAWTGAGWPWWYHTDAGVEKTFGEHTQADGWNSYFAMVEHNARWLRDLAADPAASVAEAFAEKHTDDLTIPMIESLGCDIPRVLTANILNTGGLVEGVPEDFQVEVPALFSKRGIQGIRTTPLPRAIRAHILRDMVAPVEMELAAYDEGRRDLLEELVLMDKWSVSMEQVRAFVSEIMDLPYHEQMKNHYR